MQLFWRVIGGLTLAGLGLALPRLYMVLRYQPHIHAVADVPPTRVAIVFGAGLRRDGRPAAVLYDRVLTAVELYRAGKVKKLLFSGDNRFEYYNEPGAMRAVALELGVPDSDIVLDYAGRRTYDSCYRARAIFGVTEATLVTQAFHLPRALFLCEALGLSATGVAADRREYRRSSLIFWNLREVLATVAAVWDVVVARPTPVLGEPVPIQ
ncbi:MAG: YdcF family protein [Anaerolineales bacterium]|nr:YdcF family protein [Anaerolineales bacterium]